MKTPSRIAIIGAGNVGSVTAYTLGLTTAVSEILLVDCNTKKCSGELFDLQDAFVVNKKIFTQASYKDAAKADIIIICAGKNQQPNQPRADLLHDNITIIDHIITELGSINQRAIMIIVTNPVDTLTWYVQQKNILPRLQIFGSGTWLDTKRLCNFIQKKYYRISMFIPPYVLGEHGESQYVVWPPTHSFTLIPEQEKAALAHAVKQEVYNIIDTKGYSAYGVARCVADYCATILTNQKRPLPLSVYDPVTDLCYNQLAMLNGSGAIDIINLRHSPLEQAMRERSIEALRQQKAQIR